jgi:hypothetical protein
MVVKLAKINNLEMIVRPAIIVKLRIMVRLSIIVRLGRVLSESDKHSSLFLKCVKRFFNEKKFRCASR